MVSARYLQAMSKHVESKRIAALLERAARLVHAGMHAKGIPPAQWQALAYIARANRFSRTPGTLGLYLDATKGTVSQTLIALERKGLVAKQRNESDKRIVSLSLTARGRKLLDDHPLADLEAALETMKPPELHALERGLVGLLTHLLRARDGRSFGQCRTCRFFGKNEAGDGTHRCRLLDVALNEADSLQICHEHVPAA